MGAVGVALGVVGVGVLIGFYIFGYLVGDTKPYRAAGFGQRLPHRS